MFCLSRFASPLTILLVLLSALPAFALIAVPFALKTLLDESEQILLLEVESVDPERPAMVLTFKEAWKGKTVLQRFPVNLKGDKERHTPKLLKRVAADVPVIAFLRKQNATTLNMLAYTNGTWFQLIGTIDGDTTRWAFTHCEINLRGTFRGTTEELQAVVKNVLAGKAKAPPPDLKAPPGFGPEIATERDSRSSN